MTCRALVGNVDMIFCTVTLNLILMLSSEGMKTGLDLIFFHRTLTTLKSGNGTDEREA